MREEINKSIEYGHEQNSASKDNSNDVIEKEDEKGGRSGSIWPKLAKNKILDVISRVFPSKFQQIHIISVSGHCMCLVLKFLSNCCRHE